MCVLTDDVDVEDGMIIAPLFLQELEHLISQLLESFETCRIVNIKGKGFRHLPPGFVRGKGGFQWNPRT